MAAAGVGLADTMCRYHVQRQARFGSSWAPTIPAKDLKPYLKVAASWIKEHKEEALVKHALMALEGLLQGSGRVEPASRIKRLPAKVRARVAFARLREACVPPERLLAIYLAVAANILDDADSHRVTIYRLVQTAKAAHRLASGSHQRGRWPMPDGSGVPYAFHAYPKSSGRILRVMGMELEEVCAGLGDSAVQAVRALKAERYGPHPSQLPGWVPRWRREMLKR